MDLEIFYKKTKLMIVNQKSKLAYIATSYVTDHDGISIYIENILIELGLEKNIEIDVFIKARVLSKLCSRISKNSTKSNINFIPITDSNFIASIFLVNFYINFKKYDLVFSPCLTPTFSLRNKSMKVIHDVTYKVFSKSLTKMKVLYKSILFWLLNFDNYYGYISKSTLENIKKYTNIANKEKPLILLSNGIPFTTKEFYQEYLGSIENKFLQNEMTFLFVGTMNYHKGLDVAIKFVKLISQKTKRKIILNVVGKQTKEGREIIKQNISPQVTLNVRGYIPDKQLYHLYSQSKFLLCFSRSEGFGLPIVEASSFRVFPLLSDISVFREITNDSYFYYSHDRENLSKYVETFMSIEGNFSENQYTKCILEMVERYSNMYYESSREILNILKK